MESIERLRSYAEVHWEPWDASREQLNESLDEIEQEIAERYIELPVDADGVPIHVGDTVEFGESRNQGIVKAVNECMVISLHTDCDYTNYAKYGLLWDADSCRHVNPRTIEDAISDALRDYAITDMSREEIAAKYAEEIRGMMA